MASPPAPEEQSASSTETEDQKTSSSSSSSTSSSVPQKGVAGRINYAQWDKVATTLARETEQQEKEEALAGNAKLGLNNKYARSQAEAEERQKAKQVKAVKKKLDKYQEREEAVVQTLSNLFATTVVATTTTEEETKSSESQTVRITRQDMDAGTRVLRIVDTTGASTQASTLVLTQDLCHLESKMAVTRNARAKSYPEDAENAVAEEKEEEKERSIFGVIKVFLQNVSNCTILIKCKLISGTLEMHHCDNVVVKVIGPHATVATVQMDLSNNVLLEFHDAPSGKNAVTPGRQEPSLYWGQDKDDRIFHAGVRNLTVRLYRDGMLDLETTADYIKDGAQPIGNATAEEMQFVTSVHTNKNDDDDDDDKGRLVTESVVRAGSTTGQQVRAMTQRELEEEQARREKAAQMALAKADEMIQIKDKQGNPIVTKNAENNDNSDNTVEEVLSPQVQAIVDECQQNKARGNEAFQAGEYGQAILLYSLVLDKADELSDVALFPRDVVYSNRAACFLKLGQPEKAVVDATAALQGNPQNLKALFRKGLALHAQQEYEQALPFLVQASKLEPKNQQIQQALRFCEVRLEQEHRKRLSAGL
ncbi:hypothetical protein ACA910_001958 [Epithemia clementina (nom. ined.)]